MVGRSTEDFLTCHLCKKYYTDPRYLPCLHTLCKNCITQDVYDNTGNSGNYACPLCFKPAGFPQSIAPQNVIENLPENTMVSGMVDVVLARNSMKVACQPCSRKNKSVNATHWCRFCSETLCDDCTGFHQSLKKTMRHHVMDLATMRKMSIRDMMAPPTCKYHEDEVLMLYCDDHEELLCNICTATRHRKCGSVRDVPEVLESKQNGVKALQDRLSEQTRGAEYVADDRETAVKQMDNNMASVLDEVKSLRKRINGMLEKCETQLATELKDIGLQERERLNEQVRNAQSLLSAASNSKEILKQSKENGGDIHFLNWMNQVENAVDDFSVRFRGISTDMSKRNVTFIADNKLTSLAQNITKLGTIHVNNPSSPVHSKSQRSKASSARSKSLSSRSSSIVSDRLLRRKSRTRSLLRELTPYADSVFYGDDEGRNFLKSRKSTSLRPVFSARTPSDILPCWLTGIAQLSNGLWMFADKNNKKLKLFDSYFQFKSERILREEPFDVASIGHGEFAVTVPDARVIEFFLTVNDISPIRTIKSTEKCHGISIAFDKIAVTCLTMYPPAVRVLMKDGTLLHHIAPEDGFRPLLLKPLYVTWDSGGRFLYVSDTQKDRVVCLDASKTMKFEYRHSCLASPRGIARGEGDTFYICGWGTDNIQHIDSRGVLIHEQLQRHDGVMGPQAVNMSNDNEQLVVTLDPNSCNSDVIFVFNT
ncbi:E3 ubiquitin-protein ligase TRIM56-like [Ylistrum balloti]|uniref:E3 ubiquitin-protein ligase TRIM56-like n=1 Tax=Ylistrum balloti TaxID=509963 RepID=UPI00290594A9|nr:E3 ubiquitin-protein ligase TRIM56-like [Ylistrum balloti]XP_060073874.1 E3 ubiquitin-protein ligase TRIM56-like [Ylistrum balloti]XP_060073875.1 E3 ubiquitin-protein ligase TRIM56-like [Ylistrum balloti]